MALEYMVGSAPVFVDPVMQTPRVPHPWAPGPEPHVLATYPKVPTQDRTVVLKRTGRPMRIRWADYDPAKHALIDGEEVTTVLAQAPL